MSFSPPGHLQADDGGTDDQLLLHCISSLDTLRLCMRFAAEPTRCFDGTHLPFSLKVETRFQQNLFGSRNMQLFRVGLVNAVRFHFSIVVHRCAHYGELRVIDANLQAAAVLEFHLDLIHVIVCVSGDGGVQVIKMPVVYSQFHVLGFFA